MYFSWSGHQHWELKQVSGRRRLRLEAVIRAKPQILLILFLQSLSDLVNRICPVYFSWSGHQHWELKQVSSRLRRRLEAVIRAKSRLRPHFCTSPHSPWWSGCPNDHLTDRHDDQDVKMIISQKWLSCIRNHQRRIFTLKVLVINHMKEPSKRHDDLIKCNCKCKLRTKQIELTKSS